MSTQEALLRLVPNEQPRPNEAPPGFSPDAVSCPVRLTIYLPDRDANGGEINIAYWLTAASQLLAHRFGGVSVSPAYKGYWLNSETGVLVEETTFQVCVFVEPDELEQQTDHVERLIRDFGRETGQGEVLVELNDQLLRYTSF